jgi:hypothetical protein
MIPSPARRVLAWSIGLSLLAVLTAMGLGHAQRASPSTANGAGADPYLAARLFLRQQGVAVESGEFAQLEGLNPRGGSLLLLGSRARMTTEQAEQALRWVWAGGRLVFAAEGVWDQDQASSGDLLMDRLQLHKLRTRDLPRMPAEVQIQYPQLTRLYLENEKAPAYFGFDPAWHLEDPLDQVDAWANSATATHLMRLPWGAGLITVVSDDQLWRKQALSQYDNAWLLWYLTQGTRVTLLDEVGPESLPAWLWRLFPQALLALAALLLLAAARWAPAAATRWGSPSVSGRAPTPLPERLGARAKALYRQAGPESLLLDLQHDIARRARGCHPGFERLPIAEQWQLLAQRARLPTTLVSQALRPRAPRALTAAEFSRQVAHLQIIRNAL